MIKGNVYYDSEELWHLVRKAEDEGKEVFVHDHEDFDWIISRVEIDGEEIENDNLLEEIYDATDGWIKEGEALWRQ